MTQKGALASAIIELDFPMKWIVLLTLFGTAALPGPAQTSTTHPAHNRYPKRKRRIRAAVPSYQLHPDQERYQEIQKALADRGYFKGEVNGQWSDDSTDALKRFQADQKLPDDGKINSLSLIGLGLGAKHNDGSVASPSSPTAPAAPPPSQGPAPASSENPPQ